MSNYPKPVNFRPAANVTRAWFSDHAPPFLRRPARRGRKRQGLLYQSRAADMLQTRYGDLLVAEPWICFDDAHANHRWCQPDFLLVDVLKGRITIIEAKYQHCPEAWFQLFQLYKPVVSHLFPPSQWRIGCVELVKWFDPSTSVPEPPVLREFIHDPLDGKFCVHIWKP